MPTYLDIQKDKLFIPVAKLEHGAVYEIVSRNLYVGVWNSYANNNGGGGFIGIREKFEDKYLFTEYEYNTGGAFGTARAFRKLEIQLPYGTVISERLKTIDNSNGKEVAFTTPRPPIGEGKGWIYKDSGEEAPHENIQVIPNDSLFNFLLPIDTEITIKRDLAWQKQMNIYRKKNK